MPQEEECVGAHLSPSRDGMSLKANDSPDRTEGSPPSETTEGPRRLFANVRIVVLERLSERIHRLLVSDFAERPRGLFANVGVVVC